MGLIIDSFFSFHYNNEFDHSLKLRLFSDASGEQSHAISTELEKIYHRKPESKNGIRCLPAALKRELDAVIFHKWTLK